MNNSQVVLLIIILIIIVLLWLFSQNGNISTNTENSYYKAPLRITVPPKSRMIRYERKKNLKHEYISEDDDECCDENCCPKSHGYWKNHPGDWPEGDCLTNEFDDDNWIFVDPKGDSNHSIAGGKLTINVPVGAHDPFTSFIAPRYVRTLPAGFDQNNFVLEAKMDSSVSQRFQIQGIAIENDNLNYIRFEAFHDGTRTHIYVQATTGGVVGASQNITPFPVGSSPVPLWLRLTRTGGVFTLAYSIDGTNFTSLAPFPSPLVIQRAGVYAGNAVGPNSPAHTAIFDYIRELNCLIIPSPSSIFFNSGKTYLEVLNRASMGNVYYILAKQYIALILNRSSGCNYDQYSQEIAEAENFFQIHTPQSAQNISKQERENFINLAELFESLLHC